MSQETRSRTSTPAAWLWIGGAGLLFIGAVLGFLARAFLGERPIARGYLAVINSTIYDADERPFASVYREAVVIEGRAGGREVVPMVAVRRLELDQPVVIQPVRIRVRDEAGSVP